MAKDIHEVVSGLLEAKAKKKPASKGKKAAPKAKKAAPKRKKAKASSAKGKKGQPGERVYQGELAQAMAKGKDQDPLKPGCLDFPDRSDEMDPARQEFCQMKKAMHGATYKAPRDKDGKKKDPAAKDHDKASGAVTDGWRGNPYHDRGGRFTSPKKASVGSFGRCSNQPGGDGKKYSDPSNPCGGNRDDALPKFTVGSDGQDFERVSARICGRNARVQVPSQNVRCFDGKVIRGPGAKDKAWTGKSRKSKKRKELEADAKAAAEEIEMTNYDEMLKNVLGEKAEEKVAEPTRDSVLEAVVRSLVEAPAKKAKKATKPGSDPWAEFDADLAARRAGWKGKRDKKGKLANFPNAAGVKGMTPKAKDHVAWGGNPYHDKDGRFASRAKGTAASGSLGQCPNKEGTKGTYLPCGPNDSNLPKYRGLDKGQPKKINPTGGRICGRHARNLKPAQDVRCYDQAIIRGPGKASPKNLKIVDPKTRKAPKKKKK